MAVLDVIEFFDQNGDVVVCKVPYEGSGEFRLGSQLIVQESQEAIFFRDGRALDQFSAGRHTLSTRNLPLLGTLIGAPFGGKSPFRSYVYFVGRQTFINLGWGTKSPVMFRDSEFRMVSLRAFGSFSLRVSQPRTLLMTLVGSKGLETTFALEEYLRTIIVGRLNRVLSEQMDTLLDLPRRYDDISIETKQQVRGDFVQYGLELVDLVIEAITVPPDVQEMLNRATSVAAQDAEKYRLISAADAMRDAAKNQGGAGDGLGAGIGIALGMGMARECASTLGPPATPPASAAGGSDIRSKLKLLKEMLDDGLISADDFEERKGRLLDEL